MSRVFKGLRALLASPASSSSSAAAAAKFSSSSAFTATAGKSATSKAVQKTPKKPIASKPKTEKPATPRTTTRPSGIFKLTPVSPALARFLGAPEASRSDAVKQIWSYIKSQNLQVIRYEKFINKSKIT
uniref:DM2 domain-containing protein n=1 Tax=Gossypium raimondii TaxID=29730 RepID=A0A0D2QXN3_GOSRA|nr:hypothetical protein B456_007G250300 [Gossypium raimondii]